ncbi:hypothetical protein pdam_00000090 [Pocillopora damicornis]|uniref:C2H2-type domain-containing protein n=1 Tax=Pocillopora damicornis TaxID=46731 RepID=A0A3M6UXQ7_POCDA|nr:hypothetical protein pdam_00000090 [Pocillopora damicornis]
MTARDTQRWATLPLTLELRQVYSADQLAQFGAPQGLTRLIALETFSKLIVEVGGYQQRARIPERGSSRELYPIRHRQNKKARYSCQEEGCIKTFQSLAAIQKHPNKDKHSEADKKIRL